MFNDARALSSGELLETDVCIVGAGAAGITLANEFAGAAFRVMIVESGGLTFEHRNQMLYIGDNIGRPYFAQEFTRRRQFGGTTVAWFGRCRPLDPYDFERRDWIAHSGWPFSRKDLDPYYMRAQAICQAGPYDYDPDPEPVKSDVLQTKIFRFSPPLDFGQAYRADLERAGNIRVLLHANVTGITLTPDRGSVSHLECATLARKRFRVKSRIFILAAGALENTRLLLASRETYPDGIGNQHDLLGRYFMEHPNVHSAAISHVPAAFPAEYLKLDYEAHQTNLGLHKTLGLPEAGMRKEHLLNVGSYLVKRSTHKMDDRFYTRSSNDVMKLVEMLEHKTRPSLQILAAAAGAALKGPEVAGLALQALRSRARKQAGYSLRLQLESAPNPESRVVLSRKKDALGMPRLDLIWKTTQQDVDSYRHCEELILAGLTAAGFKLRKFKHELSPDGWPASMIAGKHHMGTTRMDTDPRKGVVDQNCRIHEVGNLFVASASVFPTGGMANPTLTIVALAVRLADHIKARLGA